MAAVLLADQPWLDRHFLPSFLMPRAWYVGIETGSRLALGALGCTLIAAARRIGGWLRLVASRYGVRLLAATVLAVVASELALQHVALRPAEWRVLDEEPRRQPDAELGWTFVPGRTASARRAGRTIDYAFDPSGYRVRRDGDRVDVERASILFAGESVIFGDGLTYDETVPAQVGSALGVQPVNLGVYGFSTDQAYLALRRALPRFHHPVAVVMLFMTTLFGRNLDDDRPHLTRGLVWQPARERGRMARLAGLLFPFRRDATVENGIALTRDVLRETVAMVRARGATPLILVPQLGPESDPERSLRRRILDEPQLPYIDVPLDSSWHLPWDQHPDARAAQAIAKAVAARLRGDASP